MNSASIPHFPALKKTSFVLPSITSGDLEVSLAQTPEDLFEVQKLHYRIFQEEYGSHLADPEKFPPDPFDSVCDHLIVRDRKTKKIVGSYRLARRESAKIFGSFYTALEYDISPLLDCRGEILELSRSCVSLPYRGLPTMHLLWRGLAEYALGHQIKFFFGCASFFGIDPQKYAHAISYLYYSHLAPPAYCPRALEGHYVDMRLLKSEEVDVRKAVKEMPPLVKGYLRIGGFVGDGIFVDKEFNSTDVCIVVKTDLLTRRYANYYNVRSTQKNRFSDHEIEA